jgi:hypothetical protein
MIVLCAVNCSVGEEYLLKIEEVEGPPPRFKYVEGAPEADSGWLDVANGSAHKVSTGNTVELLVSTSSPFHLKLEDHGEVRTLDGRLERSKRVLPQQPNMPNGQPQPPHIFGEQGEDFLIHVKYMQVTKDGQHRNMESPVPIRFGKKFCLSGMRMFPTTLWSLEKAKPEQGK